MKTSTKQICYETQSLHRVGCGFDTRKTGQEKRFMLFALLTNSWLKPSPNKTDFRRLSQVESGRSVQMTTHNHLRVFSKPKGLISQNGMILKRIQGYNCRDILTLPREEAERSNRILSVSRAYIIMSTNLLV